MKIQVKNLRNENVREIELAEDVFGYEYKEHLIHLAVKSHLAAKRSGSHKTKGRGEVAGSGRKLWRQKGTGRARIGGIRSPLWRSGGIVHGPQPRSYADKLSVREKKNALKSALSRKVADEQLTVVDSFELESHKTQALVRTLGGMGVASKALLVDSRENGNLLLAARNNPKVKAVDALGVNVYDVIGREHLIVSESALDRLVEVLGK
ncbi:MAG: 50S ribosomal protein L4 [Holophagales bacterium]|nr:50S ribosomal protein L4 [Holophagales bacterium]